MKSPRGREGSRRRTRIRREGRARSEPGHRSTGGWPPTLRATSTATRRPEGFVTDKVVDRFCTLGRDAVHRERRAALAELAVDQFAVYLMHDQQEETMEACGRVANSCSHDGPQ